MRARVFSSFFVSNAVVLSCVFRVTATGRCVDKGSIYVTEYGTALTTILPILFLYLKTVIVTAGIFEP